MCRVGLRTEKKEGSINFSKGIKNTQGGHAYRILSAKRYSRQ